MLDCCEHLIDAVAPLAEAIRLEAPRVSILSTSREPLRADGEHIYTLPPLAVPPDGVVLSAEEIHRYPAASLFLERARASGLRRMLSDGDAEVIADICRRVDGIALALELAAGRVSVHGLKGTASLLDGRLRLWQGRRTARTRHKTLNATLDWSYDLASVEEQIVLRRLSVLVGSFTLEEAETVAGGVAGDQGEVVEVVARLVAKSLVSADPDAEAARYRLMDTTRAYGRGKLFESGEEPDIARRHAIYFLAWLQRRHARPFGQWSDIGTINAIPLGNIRAALEWCASRPDETELHVELAAHSADLLLELSLLNESRRVCERALSALDVSKSSTRSEMILRGALGRALLLTDNSGGDTDTHFERALEISDALGDAIYRFRILNDLHIYYRRAALYHRLTPTAEQAMSIAVSVNEAKLTATASLMLGVSHHLVGNLAAAGVALRCSIQRQLLPGHEAAGIMDFRSKAHLVMAQTLWLQGFPDQAADTVREAERFEPANDLSTCQALIIAMEVFRLMRDWGAFEKRLDRLILLSRRANLEPYGWLGRGFQGELCLRSGEVDSGISIIRDAVGWLRADRFELFLPWLTCTLAHGLAIKGYQDQALDFVLGEIDILYERGGAYQLPELLRFHGDLLVGAGADTQAEAQYLQSIAVAKQQGALSWHLRTATSLARLWSRQGRRSDARKLLEGAYVNFTEGFGSEDAKAAKLLLDPSTEDGLPRQAG
jgi:predicted ATPase